MASAQLCFPTLETFWQTGLKVKKINNVFVTDIKGSSNSAAVFKESCALTSKNDTQLDAFRFVCPLNYC